MNRRECTADMYGKPSFKVLLRLDPFFINLQSDRGVLGPFEDRDGYVRKSAGGGPNWGFDLIVSI